MKLKNILLIALPLIFISCEDVVDLELPKAKQELVIEANAIQYANKASGTLRVKLSLTNNFYDELTIPVNDADIILQVNNSAQKVPFKNDGLYSLPISFYENTDYELTVNYKEQTYSARTKLFKTVPIDSIQLTERSFTDDNIALNAFFTDPDTAGDCYLFLTSATNQLNEVSVTDDELFNGNTTAVFYSEELKPKDTVTFKIQGISQDYKRFLNILLQQSNSGAGGNPFSSPPSKINGNFVNQDNPEKRALGFFSISQEYELDFIIPNE